MTELAKPLHVNPKNENPKFSNIQSENTKTISCKIASQNKDILTTKNFLNQFSNDSHIFNNQCMEKMEVGFNKESGPQIINFLIRNGADVNSADNDGQTALHDSLKSNAPIEIIELLLSHGANPNLKDFIDGRTPLDYAVEHNAPIDVINLLMLYGALPTVQDKYSNTPEYLLKMRLDCLDREA